MTAEIAILNKHGVAVAADSAATLGDKKVHLTANKIFRIGAKAPIGLMIYGSAEAAGIPWEVLAKLFRRTRSEKHFSTLSMCFDDLCSFVTDPKLTEKGTPTEDLARLVFDICLKVKRQAERSKAKPTTSDLADVADEMLLAVQGMAKIPVQSPTLATLRKDHGQDIEEIACHAFKRTSITGRLRNVITAIAHAAIGRQYPTRYRSGFVVFGYGDDQIFPALSNAAYDLAPLGIPRVFGRNDEVIEASFDEAANIMSFAQNDAAKLFMEGASTELMTLLKKIVRLGVEKHLDEALGRHLSGALTTKKLNNIKRNMRGEISGVVKDLFDSANDQIHKDLTRPVLQSMNYLTKEDLAKLAESLVDVTALKRKFSDKMETVGGPIDVAVVSKADGFIWIKRKHYFNRELNVHFESLYDEVPTGGTLP